MFFESLGLLSLMFGTKVRSGCIDRPSLARIHMFYERQIIQDPPAPEFFASICTNHHTNRLYIFNTKWVLPTISTRRIVRKFFPAH
jgi:hypothetical protein